MTVPNYLILTVGYMHSGKTSFARDLMKRVPALINLERDPIAMMINRDFPALKKIDQQRNLHDQQTIKNKIYELLLNETIHTSLPILISTCNTTRQTRRNIIERYRNHSTHNRHIIIVYFDIAMSILEKRVRHSHRSTDVLSTSQNFAEALEKQKRIFDVPTPDEADLFLTIHDNYNTDEVLHQLASLLQA